MNDIPGLNSLRASLTERFDASRERREDLLLSLSGNIRWCRTELLEQFDRRLVDLQQFVRSQALGLLGLGLDAETRRTRAGEKGATSQRQEKRQ